jgi:hypothetical protein
MTPALKAPGIERLKLKYDDPLSNFAFKFNLRRYNKDPRCVGLLDTSADPPTFSTVAISTTITDSGMFEAGAYTRPLSSSTLAPFVG